MQFKRTNIRQYRDSGTWGHGCRCDILVTWTVTYMPYKNGQNQCGCGCQCPVTENVWAIVSVPVASATVPTITAGDTLANPTGMNDCCNVTNAMSLVSSFNLATA